MVNTALKFGGGHAIRLVFPDLIGVQKASVAMDPGSSPG
ncbi:hypothetical protein J2X44_003174 [Sphingopyxis sp. BE259]|nr:hypothetical protein [Sphingopyxis sp. BE122]MDR7228638.1 hypothetical protein [Sphingopyxis sp. BE259]